MLEKPCSKEESSLKQDLSKFEGAKLIRESKREQLNNVSIRNGLFPSLGSSRLAGSFPLLGCM